MNAGQAGLAELFADKQYCYDELNAARRKFESRQTTYEDYCKLTDALAFMYLYCPEEIQSLVQATMDEANRRCVRLFGKLPE